MAYWTQSRTNGKWLTAKIDTLPKCLVLIHTHASAPYIYLRSPEKNQQVNLLRQHNLVHKFEQESMKGVFMFCIISSSLSLLIFLKA